MKQQPITITTGYGRAAGTTYKQLAALPDGGIYIVRSGSMADHCRRILETQGRDPRAVKFMLVNSNRDLERLRGLRRDTAVDIDHDARGKMGPNIWAEACALIERLDRPLPEIRYEANGDYRVGPFSEIGK